MTLIDKKEIILTNANKILSYIEEQDYPRWSEFINRKIKNYLSALYSSTLLKDTHLAKILTQQIIELEIIRENPLLALNINGDSFEEMIETCNFQYSKDVCFSNSDGEIFGRCEAKHSNKNIGSTGVYFTPDWEKYNETVATNYSKAITRNDIIFLASASMYFAKIDNATIKESLEKWFDYYGELPSFYNLKYVAIIWGSTNVDERATLSIPSFEMGENDLNGEYRIYFHRVTTSDVEMHYDSEFIENRYKKFSEIYSESFPDHESSLYLIDDYYAIFA